MILARGAFDPRQILEAAVGMSVGATADHAGPTTCHPNGWGAMWRTTDSAALAVHRDDRPLADSADPSPITGLQTDFLAIHARHATVPANLGLQFTHPLVRADPTTTWYFMHHGYLPTVHRLLGLAASRFDSAEYFQYAIPVGTTTLEEAQLLERLSAIALPGSSGNAIAATVDEAYVIHWSLTQNLDRRYYTMYRLETDRVMIVASEVIAALAPAQLWQPLPPGRVLRISLKTSDV
jgi:glutamine amidotransferase